MKLLEHYGKGIYKGGGLRGRKWGSEGVIRAAEGVYKGGKEEGMLRGGGGYKGLV